MPFLSIYFTAIVVAVVAAHCLLAGVVFMTTLTVNRET